MKAKLDKSGKTAVITLPKKVVREQTASLSRVLAEVLGQGVQKVVLDVEKTILLDSASLGVLIYARKNHPADSVELVIRGASGYVLEILENSKLDRLFTLEAKGESK